MAGKDKNGGSLASSRISPKQTNVNVESIMLKNSNTNSRNSSINGIINSTSSKIKDSPAKSGDKNCSSAVKEAHKNPLSSVKNVDKNPSPASTNGSKNAPRARKTGKGDLRELLSRDTINCIQQSGKLLKMEKKVLEAKESYVDASLAKLFEDTYSSLQAWKIQLQNREKGRKFL